MVSLKERCCIRGCSYIWRRNIGVDGNLKYYRFPQSTLNAVHIIYKRNIWINAVENYVRRPIDWEPTRSTRICSAHFYLNKKSENPSHPSYLPKIFPDQKNSKRQTQSFQRFERLQQRREKTTTANNNINICDIKIKQIDENSIAIDEAQPHHAEAHNSNIKVNNIKVIPKIGRRSITCQTEDFINISSDPTYFSCNLNYSNGVSTAEVQVNIAPTKRTLDKVCQVDLQPPKKTVKDSGCDPINFDSSNPQCEPFHGITSIINDDSLSSLVGVSSGVFNFLLKILPDCKTQKVNKKTKLLITLMKLKTGLTFTTLSVIFNIHRITAQRIFMNNLEQLKVLLKKLIFWPSRATIEATLPEVFRRNHPKTRVIINCIEVKTEVPPEVRERVLMYSDYKQHHSIKFMLGCSPSGFISFVSKCYSGRTSNCFIITDCGIVDLIEPGDVVLADKSLPQIKTEIEKKNAVVITSSFCRNVQLSSQKVEETNNVAFERINIERVNQRIKDFNILTKIPVSLLPHIDDIVFVICALVNIEKPVIK